MNQELLSTAEEYFQSQIAPRAAIIDQSTEALSKALWEMGDRGWLGLRVPEIWGGLALDERTFYQFQMLVARYSGALAFLQTQHQSAASLIASSPKSHLQAEYLPSKKFLGVGFSQLRRPGKPMMRAIPVPGGYQLEGEIPWVTGFGIFEEFIVGATLPGGEALYGLVPLESRQTLEFSKPLNLMAMQSTNTVQARFKGWFLPSDRLVTIKPSDAIHQGDRQKVLHHGFFAIGCAQGALDILANHPQASPVIEDTWQELSPIVNNCREEMLNLLKSSCFPEKLQLRAKAINLAHRCAHIAVVSVGGAANVFSHPAGRVYREALLFSVSGQTPAVKEATLNSLVFSG